MSLLNHSCDPNCSIVFSGPHLLLRAIRDIPAGEEVKTCVLYRLTLHMTLPKAYIPKAMPEGQLLIVFLLRERIPNVTDLSIFPSLKLKMDGD